MGKDKSLKEQARTAVQNSLVFAGKPVKDARPVFDSTEIRTAKKCCRLMCWMCDNDWPVTHLEGYRVHLSRTVAPNEVCRASEIRAVYKLGTESVAREE